MIAARRPPTARKTALLDRETAGMLLAQLVEPLVVSAIGPDFDRAMLIPQWRAPNTPRPSDMTRKMAAWLAGRRCIVCGGRKRLQAHHALPFHLWPQWGYEHRLWRPLCRGNPAIDCHEVVGHAGNLSGLNIFVDELAGLLAKIVPLNRDIVRLLKEVA